MTVALVDCNNFYAACELLFRPDLRSRPLIVLSNNDGCVVARSPEAKALGIQMGTPAFQLRHQIEHHGIVVCSSNYALYADLSARVMQTLEAVAPAVDVYSIDEAFVDLAGIDDAATLGRRIRGTVDRWVGLPVSVGIAATRTLAKIANHGAKQYPATGGVVDLRDPGRRRRLLELTDVSEVWGVGPRLKQHLGRRGIGTAAALADSDPAAIRRGFSVMLERTVLELRGIPCFRPEESPEPKQQIICSRAFGHRIEALGPMREAVAHYATRAAERLREAGQAARAVTVFMRTSGFGREPQYADAATTQLPEATADTRDILAVARRLIDAIWRAGYRYTKAGVILAEFSPIGTGQRDLFTTAGRGRNSEALMATLDAINQSGHGQVRFASQGIQRPWAMQRAQLSPQYTTRWRDLPDIR